MTERTTVRLPEPLLRLAKRKAAAEGRTLTSLIEEGLRRVVNEPAEKKARHVSLPVSSAVGRVMPGIDISNSAQLQELDDLGYVERFFK